VEDVDAVTAEIDRRLAAALPAGSPNAITAAELREWAAEYLRRHDDEVARIPNLAGCPHWNLWMRDKQFGEGLFVVVAFRPDGMELLCGTGNAADVRQVSNNESPDDPTAVFGELRERFPISEEPLRLDRRAAEAWLGRPRPW
jgi:hypothetical protein